MPHMLGDSLTHPPTLQKFSSVHIHPASSLALPPSFRKFESTTSHITADLFAHESESEDDERVSKVLTDSEISAKLQMFSGSNLGLDEETQKVVGKLLTDEKDEKVNADSETFAKLYTMIGGSVAVFVFVMQNIFFRYIEVYTHSLTNAWSDASAED